MIEDLIATLNASIKTLISSIDENNRLLRAQVAGGTVTVSVSGGGGGGKSIPAPAPEEPKKRGRPAAVPTPAPEPEPVAEETPAVPEPEPQDDLDDTVPSIEDMKKAIKAYRSAPTTSQEARAKHVADYEQLNASFGIPSITQLPEDRVGEYWAKLKQII